MNAFKYVSLFISELLKVDLLEEEMPIWIIEAEKNKCKWNSIEVKVLLPERVLSSFWKFNMHVLERLFKYSYMCMQM